MNQAAPEGGFFIIYGHISIIRKRPKPYIGQPTYHLIATFSGD